MSAETTCAHVYPAGRSDTELEFDHVICGHGLQGEPERLRFINPPFANGGDRDDVPIFNRNFEPSVPGLYLSGWLLPTALGRSADLLTGRNLPQSVLPGILPMAVSLSLLSSRGGFARKGRRADHLEHLDQISRVLRASNRGTDGYAGTTNSRNPGSRRLLCHQRAAKARWPRDGGF